MAYIAAPQYGDDRTTTYFADSETDVPFDAEEHFRVGDTFICKAGETGIVTYILFPSGWHKVG